MTHEILTGIVEKHFMGIAGAFGLYARAAQDCVDLQTQGALDALKEQKAALAYAHAAFKAEFLAAGGTEQGAVHMLNQRTQEFYERLPKLNP